MTEANERLQKARREAGYQTATDAAKAFGWNEITYRAHESGERGIRVAVAERYAKAFRVSATWLLTGEGSPDGETAEIIGIWTKMPEAARKEVLDFARWKANQDG